jgi:hypothetical protein
MKDPTIALARKIWKTLPLQVRHSLLLLSRFVAPTIDQTPSSAIEPIIVAGLLSTASGTGEAARLCLEALRFSERSASGIDLSGTFQQHDLKWTHPDARGGNGPGTLIVHLNAPLFTLSLIALGSRVIRQKRVIGYWAWELPVAPETWRSAAPFLHGILVPSHFTAKAIKAIIRKPVNVLPHPLLPVQPPQMTREECRLPRNCFLIGCVFDARSSVARKNPLGAVKAFRKAFADDHTKHLALKISNMAAAPEQTDLLSREIAGFQNVSIHQEIFTRRELQGWLANCDVVISLHRAEGFGLVLAEAMQLGKAVVATNWSGNCEFMTAQNSALVDFKLIPARDPDGVYDCPTQTWADPDTDHAADWLRRLFEYPELRTRLGTHATTDVERTLSFSRYSKQLIQLLSEQRAISSS